MTTSYPGAIDSFTNPTATDTLDSATVPHAAQHDNINDAVLAIETALGASLGNVVLPARSISTTAPLTGGGDLSANRTLSLNIGSSLTTSASNLIVDSTVVPYLANANTFTASPQQITVNAAGNKGLIVRGAASQTADLQEWQDSTGAVISRVTSSGSYLTIARISAVSTTVATANINSYISSPSLIGIIVQGATSQTADLQEWQNSAGTVLAKVDYQGNFTAPKHITTGGTSAQYVMGDGSLSVVGGSIVLSDILMLGGM